MKTTVMNRGRIFGFNLPAGIERGVENPTLFTIQAIADALKTSVGNLMKGI